MHEGHSRSGHLNQATRFVVVTLEMHRKSATCMPFSYAVVNVDNIIFMFAVTEPGL